MSRPRWAGIVGLALLVGACSSMAAEGSKAPAVQAPVPVEVDRAALVWLLSPVPACAPASVRAVVSGPGAIAVLVGPVRLVPVGVSIGGSAASGGSGCWAG